MIAVFLVGQIRLGKITYQQVITSRPDLQTQIDDYITSKGLTDSIDKIV
jgi:hypothetical protein